MERFEDRDSVGCRDRGILGQLDDQPVSNELEIVDQGRQILDEGVAQMVGRDVDPYRQWLG